MNSLQKSNKMRLLANFGFLFSPILLLFFCACTSKSDVSKASISNLTKSDTIQVTELITESEITHLQPNEKQNLNSLQETKVASISSSDLDESYICILSPGKSVKVKRNSHAQLSTESKGDSLLNYLWKSNLTFIQSSSDFIFATDDLDSIVLVFEEFKNSRASIIDKFKSELNKEELEILHFQNEARIYSFLFWLGRVSRSIEIGNSYFDFVNKIREPSIYLKSLPDIYLYKFEAQYMRKYKQVDSIPQFLAYIEDQIDDPQLSDYLKAVYLKALIESPSYWSKQQHLFNSDVLKSALEKEKSNSYGYLLDAPTKSFLNSQRGQPAYNFNGLSVDGTSISLETFKGKVVYLDVWATWCGPCLKHRPKVIDLSRKYKENTQVAILRVSVDSKEEDWLDFLAQEENLPGLDIFIEDGIRSDFGENFNIRSIPRYILIDKNGKIINSNMPEPSFRTEEAINEALSASNK